MTYYLFIFLAVQKNNSRTSTSSSRSSSQGQAPANDEASPEDIEEEIEIETSPRSVSSTRSEIRNKKSPQEATKKERVTKNDVEEINKLQTQLTQAIGLASDRSVSLMQCELRVTELQV